MIAVGTLNEFDGPTRITLAKGRAVTGKLRKLFVANLHQLTGKLVVRTCEGTVLLSGEVDNTHAKIEVFSNDQSAPDEILIVYS